MEIVSIERKTFEEMKERFGSFSQHVRELCARYRPPEKMNWMDGADVCEKLGISKRTLQTYRDRGRPQPDQPQDLLPDGGRGGVRGSHEPGNDGGRVRWKRTKWDTEEVRAYFEALEEGMRYLDTVTAHFRPAMNGEVYLTGEDVCRSARHHAENVAGLPHALADPVHIVAGQDALPPVGSAAVCWRRTTWTCAQSANGGKVQHKRTGVCIGKMQQRQGHRIGSSCLCRILHRGKASAVSRRERRTRFPSCFLSSSPARSAAWRRGCRRSPEIGAYHPVGHLGVDLGRGNVLVPEYLGERLDGASVAEIDGRGEGVAA